MFDAERCLIPRLRPYVMGVLNVTPDSFSDGGCFDSLAPALQQARQMIDEGADILDVGGESTRPGAQLVNVEQELARVIPVIKGVRQFSAIPISIDTSKPEVMIAAVQAGASMINDVRALQEPGALEAALNADVAVCLMHMQGDPQTMQDAPSYTDIVHEIGDFLQQRLVACERSGIRRRRLLIDPGFGFGKTVEQNYQLLAQLAHFKSLGLPILVGMSRKSMLGKLLGRELDQRLPGSLAAAMLAAQQGAAIIRVHDVWQTVDAMRVFEASMKVGEV